MVMMSPGMFGSLLPWVMQATGAGQQRQRTKPNMSDPLSVADAQMDMNREALWESQLANQVNQWTPWGGTYWTGEIGSPDRTQHTVYNPMLGSLIFGDSYHPHFGGGMGPGGGGYSRGPWWRDRGYADPETTADATRRRDMDYGDGPEVGADFSVDVPSYTGSLADMMAAAYGRVPGQLGNFGKSFKSFISSIPGALSKAIGGGDTPDYGGIAAANEAIGTPGYEGGPGDAPGSYGGPDTGGDYGADQGGAMFQQGGFTGLGADGIAQPNRAAGTVHENEFVIPATEPGLQALVASLMGNPGENMDLAQLLAKAQMGGIGERALPTEFGDIFSGSMTGAGAGHALPPPASPAGGRDMMAMPPSEMQMPKETAEQILARLQLGNRRPPVGGDMLGASPYGAGAGLADPSAPASMGGGDMMAMPASEQLPPDVGRALIEALSTMGASVTDKAGAASDELIRAAQEAEKWAQQQAAGVPGQVEAAGGALSDLVARGMGLIPAMPDLPKVSVPSWMSR